MKHLYYARHGQSLVNVGGQFCTRVGTPLDQGLTELGRQQALQAGRRAQQAGFSFDLVLSSPLVRAQETAQLIAEQVGYPSAAIQTLELLIELQFGELEGTQCDLFYDNYSYADLDKFHGAETITELQARAGQALEQLRGLPDQHILVVSHSLFGRALRRVVNGQPASDEFVHGQSLPHGDIIQLI